MILISYKNLILVGVIVLVVCCTTNSKQEGPIVDSTSNSYIITDSDLIRNNNSTYLEFFVNRRADSINHCTSVDKLPTFLKDTQFDQSNSGIFSSFHNPLPLRKLIIDKVINCTPLKLILEDKSGIYKRKPQKRSDFKGEFMDLSIYDLASDRSKQLNCK